MENENFTRLMNYIKLLKIEYSFDVARINAIRTSMLVDSDGEPWLHIPNAGVDFCVVLITGDNAPKHTYRRNSDQYLLFDDQIESLDHDTIKSVCHGMVNISICQFAKQCNENDTTI